MLVLVIVDVKDAEKLKKSKKKNEL